MKKLWFFSAVFLLAGVIMLLVPIHMQPTGVCGSCDTDGGNGNPYIQWPI